VLDACTFFDANHIFGVLAEGLAVVDLIALADFLLELECDLLHLLLRPFLGPALRHSPCLAATDFLVVAVVTVRNRDTVTYAPAADAFLDCCHIISPPIGKIMPTHSKYAPAFLH